MKQYAEVKRRVYPTHVGKIKKALKDAGFVKESPWYFSKGTKFGCLHARISGMKNRTNGKKNRTQVRVKHELNEGTKVPDYLLTNDMHAEQALIDIQNILSGNYAPEEVAKLMSARAEKIGDPEPEPRKFDKSQGYEVVMLGISVTLDDNTRLTNGRYVEDAIAMRPNDVKAALEESEGLDEYFAILADGKSPAKDMRRATRKVVPYLYKHLKKKKKHRSKPIFL